MPTESQKYIIDALVAFGHSPAKALEIAIDHERGDRHAAAWVAQAAQ